MTQSDKKRERVAKAKAAAAALRTKRIRSLSMCFGRSDVMRVHHNQLVHEALEDPSAHPFRGSDARALRFFTYVSYWFAGLAAVIERYQELRSKDAIPACSTIDGLLTADKLDLIKPFRNAVAHCSETDDARFHRLVGESHTVPDWAEDLSQALYAYFTRHPPSGPTENHDA